MESVECGAASLAMILAHHGRWVPLEQLRLACGVSRDGSKASNIVKAARAHGLIARGFKKEPDGLVDLPMPCILHWNFNHFLVLEGIDDRHAHLNDPRDGRRRVDRDELSDSFTGVVLAFEKAPDFEPSRPPSTALRTLARLVAHSRLAVSLLVLLSIALVVPGVVLPALSKIFVDDVLVQGAASWLAPVLAGLALTAFARALMTALQQSLLIRLQTKISVVMSARFLWHVLHLPLEFFAQRHAGDLAGRIEANERVARLISGGLATNALNFVSVGFFAAMMVLYEPWLAAIAIGLGSVNLLVVALVHRRRDELSRGLAVERGKLMSSTVGIVRTIETIKAAGYERDSFSVWSGYQALVLNLETKLGHYETLGEVLPPLLAALTTGVILVVGGARVMAGELSIGGLIAFQSLAGSFSAPIAGLVQFSGTWLTARSDLARIEDVFNYPLPEAAPVIAHAARLSGRVEVRDLAFHHAPLSPPTIEGINLEIEPGARVALVGASGSGKSTIGRLIAGLARPSSGTIRFDAMALESIPEAVRAVSIAHVDQHVFLFEGSVRDNVTLWDPEIPESDIIAALADAEVLDDVLSRPGGLDGPVEEGGANLSGGQRQRIEIARALVRRPNILILDEATSALDALVEKRIDEHLRRRGCTTIIIAHRLSTIRDCDEIVLLEGGRIIERGTHEALLARSGAYAGLLASA